MNRDQWYQKRSQFDEGSMPLADVRQVIGGRGGSDETTIAGAAIGSCDHQVNHDELTCCEWATGLQANPAKGKKGGNGGSHACGAQ